MPKLIEGSLPYCVIYHDSGQTLCAKAVSIYCELTGLFASWHIMQEFRNECAAPIEAGYMFTIPCRTEFLGLNMRIGSRSFMGKVIKRKDFRGYMGENTIDSIIRFDEPAYGEYGANLGLIPENETIVADLRFANFLDYENEHILLHIPAWSSGSCAILDITITLKGDIANCDIHSPSHFLSVDKLNGNQKILKLCSSSPLDRDFILQLKRRDASSSLLQAASNGAQVMAASFTPLSHQRKDLPIFVNFLVDCSGSMDGTFINEVKRGLLEVARLLQPEDHVSYSRFGNEVEHLWRTPRPCYPWHIRQLVSEIKRMNANMGGTNMEDALLSTFSYATRTETVDLAPAIILITDGQARISEKAIGAARKSHNRVYAVGVGEFIDEEILCGIAEKTGGICETASSDKDIAEAIVRMFKKIPRSIASDAQVHWPEITLWEADIPHCLYPGQSIHCFAGIGNRSNIEDGSQYSAKLRYTAGINQYEIIIEQAEILENPDLVRFAYGRLLEECLYKEERQYLGMHFQLLTDQTALILTEGQSSELPESEEDFHMICKARSWNNRVFLCDEESARRNALSHSAWIERQRNISRELAKGGNKNNAAATRF